MPLAPSINCSPAKHYQQADGWLRCPAMQINTGRRMADAKVCPFCAVHFRPERGSAVVHVRACARRHGAVWPI